MFFSQQLYQISADTNKEIVRSDTGMSQEVSEWLVSGL